MHVVRTIGPSVQNLEEKLQSILAVAQLRYFISGNCLRSESK